MRHDGFGGAFWEGLDAYLGGLLSILAIQNTYETTYETIERKERNKCEDS